MKSYTVPAHPQETTTIVKKSQFICHIKHCEGRDQAQAFVSEIKELHPNANHNCWAHIAGAPQDSSCWGMSDDGEPKGCAGKPMFNVLHHSDIGEICAVVTRYFGGIKLGTGGMARAYSGAVKHGLETLELITKHRYKSYSLEVPYPLLKTIERILEEYATQVLNSDYGATINLSLRVREDSLIPFLAVLETYAHQGVALEEAGEKND